MTSETYSSTGQKGEGEKREGEFFLNKRFSLLFYI